MRLIIMGPQGSGKGTQAKILAENKQIPHISTGDIFRENMKNGTPLGKTAAGYMNKGELVPDDLTIELIRDRFSRDDCKNGFILDGFPRNVSQAKALDTISEIDKVLLVDVPDEISIKRISGRRTCEGCGAIYNINYDKIEDKCLKCDGNLIVRDDDKPDSVSKRLEIYHENTSPVLNYYEEKGILVKINGDNKIELISQEILGKVN